MNAAAEILLRYEPPPRTPLINGKIVDPNERATKFDDPESRDALHDQLLTVSCAYYAIKMLQGPLTAPYHGKFLIGRHHLEWDEAIREHNRILTRAARDHGKSFFWCVSYPIWKADYNHPGSLGYIFSASQTLAEERLKEATDQLEGNKKLEHLVPVGRDRTWTKREIKTATNTVIRARGWGTRIRGGHPHWIVADDCLDDHSLYSETIRNRSTEFFFSAISNMIVPDGQIVIDGTPMHFADLYGKVEQTKRYYVLDFPARNDQGEVLFPERYSDEALLDKAQEIGPTRFAREFMVQPLTDEASLFPSHLFAGNEVRVPYRLGLPASYWEEKGWLRYTGVDIALSTEVGADYFVIFTVAVDGAGIRWIVDILREKGMSFQAQKDAIKEAYAKYLPEVIHIEANQMQRVWPQEIVRETSLPIRSFFTSGTQPKQDWKRGMTTVTVNKHHLDRGVPSLRLSLENKRWKIPRGDEVAIEKTDQWMGELQCISIQEGKVVSVGEHDDLVMATWMADTAIRLSGGLAAYWAGPDGEQQTQDPHGSPVVGADKQPGGIEGEIPPTGDIEEENFDPFGLGSYGGDNPLLQYPGVQRPDDDT